ncbi:MAG: hypothetical protein P3B76_14030 [Gemmatimonadota bacterium]|jgi:hypothetical protein|nr:hypothetical protein [Gemmatimonadota bacterium]MDQ8173795.1 hypothetical protein [Gemmatimonadota bacterium]
MTPSTTTVGSWFAAIQPSPPEGLRVRLTGLLEPFAHQPVDRVPEACLEAGERLLGDLLASGSTSRETALDLLAVDALVTYAFQAAADAPDLMDRRAARALASIAALPGSLSL